MLKLIIHAGLHKTGTTTFQHICCKFADFLLKNKIYYQTHEKMGALARTRHQGTPQHSYLVWEFQKQNYDELRLFLNNGKSILNNDGTILISGEDFENCLIDHEMLHKVELIAKEEGIDQIEWIFVCRRQIDYLKSLYAQLSNQNIIANIHDMAKAILANGFFQAVGPNFKYFFVFDYKKIFNAFRQQTRGMVRIIGYEQFCKVFPGHIILEEISGKMIQMDYIKERIDPKINLNPRIKPAEAEFYYLCTRFNIRDAERLYHAHKKMIDVLLAPRVYYIKKCAAKIERDFSAVFDTVK